MKKLIFLLSCIILIGIISGCSGSDKYKKHIDELNAKLPQEKGGIRVDKISVEDQTFKCYYTILVDLPAPAEGELMQAKTMLAETIKNDPTYKVFRDDNMNFLFVYRKADGSMLWETKLTPEDYK